MCMWSINRQKAALRSQDRSLSAMHLKTSQKKKNQHRKLPQHPVVQILVSKSTVGLANEVYGPSRGKAVRESQSCAAIGVKLLFYRTKFFCFLLKAEGIFWRCKQ